ncbi:D-glycero-beta-D-manno-heptose 1-phosphate adenylyltransferase [Thermoflavifilum thermophilum]|uniref:D-glycero-beta-D-manno-heptose 1-phosphate adenylyltransferase n=1 Tax=Thermoflavifilum thermophilum TaxID=1393122 RepID=A0A1I7NJH3_9BACT|nr:D-glycero-beta-D-manno-heptose 1-phosphate adenylyltransferase [Thermoflavifilum thermophilum]SFV34798.1 rfaE bifunctional protein, domain II [Thermoflavifilum thermophilum]
MTQPKFNLIQSRIADRTSLSRHVHRWRLLGKKIVFTNGCFDLLHRGHIRLLSQAADLGDVLIVGINSDDSVKKLKGPERPLVAEQDRALLLAALCFVDAVTIFDEETPYELIRMVQPDVLVKGEDYAIDEIVGADIVQAYGGEVKTIPLETGYSTTALLQQIRSIRG